MDRTNLDHLIAYLKDLPPEAPDFSMDDYMTPCGTAACIAGHAALLSGKEFPRIVEPGGMLFYERVGEIRSIAREFLGIDNDIASWLFEPANFSEYSLEEAIETLERFAETGEIKRDQRSMRFNP